MFVFSTTQITFAADKVVVIPLEAKVPKFTTTYNHNGTVEIFFETVINSASISVSGSGTIIAGSTVSLADCCAEPTSCGIYASAVYQEEYANTVADGGQQLMGGVIANIRHFPVTAGPHTFYQICYSHIGNEAKALKSDLSLLFVPQ